MSRQMQTAAAALVLSHNDFGNRDTSNFGQWFIGEPIVGAAAFDTQVRPVLWFDRSPYTSGSEAHRTYSHKCEALGKAFIEALGEAALADLRAAIAKLREGNL